MNGFIKFLILICLFTTVCEGSSLLQKMTLEEKVGQLLMVHFNGEAANEDARFLVQDLHVGSIIYYNWANGLHSPLQVRQLSDGLQKLTQNNRLVIPLFIAVDQEGGKVARLTEGFTIFPGNKALSMAGDKNLAAQCALAMGEEIRAVGINMNLAPVVDVNSNPKNPVIGSRSFGDSPIVVTNFAKKALEGYHQAGIITTLKHFPGHGDVETDSHHDLPIIKKTKEMLNEVELVPFSQLANDTDAIMTAHIMVPAIDSQNCATLSKNCLDILREEMGFNGVIISDSLVMEGLLKNCSCIEDAAIRAINAGCDILILGGKQLLGAHARLELTVADVKKIHQNLCDAVKQGQIKESRLNQSVQRILDLKERYELSERAYRVFDGTELIVSTDEHQALAEKIRILLYGFAT